MTKRNLIILLAVLFVIQSVGFSSVEIATSELPTYHSTNDFDHENKYKKEVSVEAFGAVGNGTSDDTKAIQLTIDYAIENNRVVVFKKDQTYKITGNIFLYSNTSIDGNNATIYMPAQWTKKSMFISTHRHYAKDVMIHDLNFMSSLEYVGSGFEEGKMISNVQGIHISGVDGLLLEDVHFDNIDTAIKFGDPRSGRLNKNITIDKFSIEHATTGMYITYTKDIFINNGFVDIDGGEDQRLHDVYLAGANEGVWFDNVIFLNSPGAGINIYSGHSDIAASNTIYLENCSFINCKRGINIWSGAKKVRLDNVVFMECSLAVSINDSSDVTCDGLIVLDAKHVGVDKGVFMINDSFDIAVSNTRIDGEGMEGYIFLLKNSVERVSICETYGENIGNVTIFYANTPSRNLLCDVTIESSYFDYKQSWKNDVNYDSVARIY